MAAPEQAHWRRLERRYEACSTRLPKSSRGRAREVGGAFCYTILCGICVAALVARDDSCYIPCVGSTQHPAKPGSEAEATVSGIMRGHGVRATYEPFPGKE